MKVYFYPHVYLRDRQLDTIRQWPRNEVLNIEIAENRRGGQVSEYNALSKIIRLSWKQKIPLLNLKIRQKNLPPDAILYVWGGLPISGRFIVDLDNPWSLVGYNLTAMPIYRGIIKRILLSKRCYEIRCMSEACRMSLLEVFGAEVYDKARVFYPRIPNYIKDVVSKNSDICRFLFVGTQFEIKGGVALVNAFRKVYNSHKNCQLTIVSHIPDEYLSLIRDCEGIVFHRARFTREEIHNLFMKNSDVLILPTYVESFGMVALEGLAHGLALIATDVYALKEIVKDGYNGSLLKPPLSVWNDFKPSKYYHDISNIKFRIREINTNGFERDLEYAMIKFVSDSTWLHAAKQSSLHLKSERFPC